MAFLRLCKFFREPVTIHMGRGIGYCDLDCGQTTCDGEIDFCEKADDLKIYLFEQMKKEGGLQWEVKRNAHFSGDLKA